MRSVSGPQARADGGRGTDEAWGGAREGQKTRMLGAVVGSWNARVGTSAAEMPDSRLALARVDPTRALQMAVARELGPRSYGGLRNTPSPWVHGSGGGGATPISGDTLYRTIPIAISATYPSVPFILSLTPTHQTTAGIRRSLKWGLNTVDTGCGGVDGEGVGGRVAKATQRELWSVSGERGVPTASCRRPLKIDGSGHCGGCWQGVA